MKKISILSLLVLFTFSAHLGASSTDEAIRGVTTFLKEQLNANKLFIFENKLLENKAFKKYFPKTHANMELASLEQLLLTGSETLSEDFEMDLENLLKEIVKSLRKSSADGAKISIAKLVCNTVDEDEFNYIFTGDKNMSDYNSTCAAHNTTNTESISDKSSSVSKLLHVLKGAEEVKEEVKNASDVTWQEINKLTTGAMFFASVSDVYKRGIGTTDSDSNSTKNEEAIAEILSSYALPVVSFRRKAESGSHIFLSAYATYSVNDYVDNKDSTSTDSVRERPNSSLYVPLGVEIGYGLGDDCCFRSIDLLLSAFDFAYPWQQQSSSSEESFSLDDIWAPSIVGSVSFFENVPIVVGIGYQETRYDESRNAFNDRRFLFVGIDMPLYRFY